MLEQITRLEQQVDDLLAQITTLHQQHKQSETHYQTRIDELQRSLDEQQVIHKRIYAELEQRQQQLDQHKQHIEQSHQQQQQLSGSYQQLEQSCGELRKRFNALFEQKNDLAQRLEQSLLQNKNDQQQIAQLNQRHIQLQQKNQHAKAKVEEIIQRLAMLGTAQDSNSAEIQALTQTDE